MDPRQLFADERLTGLCVFCGAAPDSRDHCPSKVLLDEPLPPNVPVVEACDSCNNSFSLDEQYLACLIESVLCGSAEPEDVSRAKVKRVVTEYPALAARLSENRHLDSAGNMVWEADLRRVRNVVLKLARGHVAYELSSPKLGDPDEFVILPLVAMSDEQRSDFESPTKGVRELWPEIGSRAFICAAKQRAGAPSRNWIVVQPDRYRYMVSQSSGECVQIVLSEYLACRVLWH